MDEIPVGTCSWTDRTPVGSGWYPPGRTCRLWAERTPDGFVFDVKAFSLLTGHPTRSSVMPDGLPADPGEPKVLDEVWARFTEGIEPLRPAGSAACCSSYRRESGPGGGPASSSYRRESGPGGGPASSSVSAPSGPPGGRSPWSSGVPAGGGRSGPGRPARCSPGTA
ncbi:MULTISPECIES: DUF72 domain-containing protein [unclassified Streptomyces]|uniref:DUF72 domain-containing protein n=1 Tax=unclassified Streptomyces TaxID=2593676 RepID=UPI00386F06E8